MPPTLCVRGANSSEPSCVIFSTKATIVFLGSLSFHEGDESLGYRASQDQPPPGDAGLRQKRAAGFQEHRLCALSAESGFELEQGGVIRRGHNGRRGFHLVNDQTLTIPFGKGDAHLACAVGCVE